MGEGEGGAAEGAVTHAKFVIDDPGTTNQLARLSNQPMKNAVNSAEPYRRKPTATLSQAVRKPEGATTIPAGEVEPSGSKYCGIPNGIVT